jgi:hypothetical protein
MAAPEQFWDYDFIDDGLGQDIQWVAAQIGSTRTPSTLNQSDQQNNGGWQFVWLASAGLPWGVRKPLPSARDISARRFVWMLAFTTRYDSVRQIADIPDGGLRVYLTDSAGAYRGYTIYGRDISGSNPNPAYALGSFINASAANSIWWCIDLDRTPDDVGGTLDLTDIVAVEVHVYPPATQLGSGIGYLAIGYWLASGNNIIRAGEVGNPADFTDLPQSGATWNTTSNPLYPGGARQGQDLTPIFDGANGQTYATIAPVHVGDGSTATYFRQGRGTLSNQLSMEAIKYRIAQGETPNLLPCYLPDANGDRTHTINQSASDDVEFRDFTFSGYDYPERDYAVEVTGSTSGTCSFVNSLFARAQFVRLRHSTATDCIFDGCNAVEVTLDTAMSGGIIRNAPSGTSALVVTGAAGDYSSLDVRLNNPSATYDIEVGSGGAGTYNLSGVTVPAGYTLKLHNPTATAITVSLKPGIAVTTSGPITVENAVSASYTITSIVAGSRLLIRRTDTLEVLVNESVAGTSRTYTYTHTADIPVEIVLRKATGSPAYQPFRTTATLTANGGAVTANQVLDE